MGAEAQPVTKPNLSAVFVGPEGLRAGWGLAIFIALLGAITFTGNTIAHAVVPRAPKNTLEGPLSLHFALIAESLALAAVLVVTWLMSKVERRDVATYGLKDQHGLKHFLAGLAWGVACLSLLVLALWKSGLLVIDARLLTGAGAFGYGALWLAGFFLTAMFEECLTRGYLQYTLARGLAGFFRWAFKARFSVTLGFWTAALALSVLFGLGHGQNAGESPLGLVAAGAVAMVFCLSLWRTGSLWWAIGFHAAWDWAESFLYGVADSGHIVQHRLLATRPMGNPVFSGGATGPEGSVFVFAVLALTVLITLFTLRRSKPSLEVS